MRKGKIIASIILLSGLGLSIFAAAVPFPGYVNSIFLEPDQKGTVSEYANRVMVVLENTPGSGSYKRFYIPDDDANLKSILAILLSVKNNDQKISLHFDGNASDNFTTAWNGYTYYRILRVTIESD